MIEGRIKSLDNPSGVIKDKLKPDRTLRGIFYKLLKAGYMKYPNLDLRTGYGPPNLCRGEGRL